MRLRADLPRFLLCGVLVLGIPIGHPGRLAGQNNPGQNSQNSLNLGTSTLGICLPSIPEDLQDQAELGLELADSWLARFDTPVWRHCRPEALVRKAREILDLAIKTKEMAWSEARTQRDRLWLQDKLDAAATLQQQKTLADLEAELARLRAEGEGLDGRILAQAPAWQALDVSNVRTAGYLAAAQTGSQALALARGRKLDMVLWSRIIRLDSYSFLEITLTDVVMGDQITQILQPLDDDRLVEAGLRGFDALMPGMLGGEPASLEVLAKDARTIVHLSGDNGLDYGSLGGPWVWQHLLPGRYRVRAQTPAAFDTVRDLDLGPGEHLSLDLPLVRREPRLLHLDSQPSGALVHDGVAYLGTTPMDVDLAAVGDLLLIRLEGYDDRVLRISDLVEEGARDDLAGPGQAETPQVPDPVMVTLFPRYLDWGKEIPRRRTALYESLGWFALSVAPAIVFNALYSDLAAVIPANYSAALASGMDEDAYLAMVRDGNVYYYLGLGSIVVCGVLLGDSLIKLSEYLQVVDQADRYTSRTPPNTPALQE